MTDQFVLGVEVLLGVALELHPVAVEEWLEFFQQLFNLDASYLLAYLGDNVKEISIVQRNTLRWLSLMGQYVEAYERVLAALAVRFEDLTKRREQALMGVFEYCGLGASKVGEAPKAFESDVHEGTMLAQERAGEEQWRLSAEQVDEIRAILARHPVIDTPGFTAPGTLQGV